MNSWAITLNKEYFKFSCAHFLIFPDGSKERLHGHNYHVSVDIDFIDAKPVIRELCDSLDEHWLLPAQHPELQIRELDDGHTSVVYRDCRYLVPSAEVVHLPINNTSVENLATWFSDTLRARLVEKFGATQVRRLRVAISETSGQSGVCEYRSDDSR